MASCASARVMLDRVDERSESVSSGFGIWGLDGIGCVLSCLLWGLGLWGFRI